MKLPRKRALRPRLAADKLLEAIPTDKRNVFLSDLRAFVLGVEQSMGSQE